MFILNVKKLDKKEKGIIIMEGAVRMSLIIVGLASGKASAISPRAGEIAAPAITVAMEIEIIVGFNILLMDITSVLINGSYLSCVRMKQEKKTNRI